MLKPWYIWIDRQPAYDGFLPTRENWHTPVTEEEFKGAVYTVRDPQQAMGFDTEEEANAYIAEKVHPYLKQYCLATRSGKPFKVEISSMIANGIQRYHQHGNPKIANVASLVTEITASVYGVLVDRGMKLADAATAARMESLEADLKATKNKLRKANDGMKKMAVESGKAPASILKGEENKHPES